MQYLLSSSSKRFNWASRVFSLNLMKYSHILNTAREIAFGYAASQSEWMNQVRM